MAQFKINELEQTNRAVSAGQRLYLDESGTTVVAEGDPRASFLYATEGQEISREDAVRYGLVKPTKDEKAALQVEETTEEGTAQDVLDAVGSDAEKAQVALDAEQASEKPRKTLVQKLERIVAQAGE